MWPRRVVGTLALPGPSMPQDVRISPDGKLFYVADMMHDGVFLIDGERFRISDFIHTGIGTHGLYRPRRHEAVHREPRLACRRG